jgi:uncharacterized protein (TIGR02996 family)
MSRVPPDERAFLAKIVAHPDDDLPRLVYADWLEEHGQPARAEFIRTEVRMHELCRARGPRAVSGCDHLLSEQSIDSDCEYCALGAARDHYYYAVGRGYWTDTPVSHGVLWSAAVQDALGSLGGVAYERGFPVSVWTTSSALLVRGAAARLVRAAPIAEVWCSNKHPTALISQSTLAGAAHAAVNAIPHAWWYGGLPRPYAFIRDTSHSESSASHLPLGVFACLVGGERTVETFRQGGVRRQGGIRIYASMSQAQTAAARAWTRYGRRLAKLPAWGRLAESRDL